MTEKTIQLDIPLILPDISDAYDACVTKLELLLENQRGIQRVHVRHDAHPPQLCLHFDPNLISLAAVERIAREAGGRFTDRYRHEALGVNGMTSADAADSLADTLRSLPGILHANVNYAAEAAFVAYDTTILQRPSIDLAIRHMGYQAVYVDGYRDEALPGTTGEEKKEDHDHGGVPAFLPHWLQERWPLLLVALAGLFFLAGWLGETFFSMPPTLAMAFFILSYIAGGYDIATHALPSLLQGKFDTDVLMLAAAAGAALLGEWAEGAFLLFLFSLGHAGEHYALDRARRAIHALGELMPGTARVKVGDELEERP
ncbi:MAG: hypothetical protein R3293_23680, partial [Candidatus Promineifilaceae bacterium]|nr:hypothetical protein [Candidatus Promineifilaceae bacterium]